MQIIGLDYSVNSPGCVKFLVDDSLEIKEINYLGFTDVKKTAAIDPNNIKWYSKKDFDNSFQKVYWFRDHCLNFMKLNPEDVVGIEGYAFCGVGKVFNIAEATFSIKEKIYDSGAKLRIYEPTAIKKFSTGLGNADKTKMSMAFNKTEHCRIFDRLLEGNPREDLIDAFFVAQMLLKELKLRKGLLNLSSMPEKQIECFNQTSKANPENLLVRKFIQKPIDIS